MGENIDMKKYLLYIVLSLLVNMANGGIIPVGMKFAGQLEMRNSCISLEQRETLFEQIRSYKNSRTTAESVFLEDPMGNGGMSVRKT